MADHGAIADLSEHLHAHAIRTDGPFTLRSGRQVSWYLDARQTTFDGAGAVIVGRAVLGVLADVEAVGGLTMGADPIAVAVAIEGTRQGRALRAFSIRKAAKDHGLGGRLVGPVAAGSRVAIMEDTTTTGGAFFEAIDVARSEGLDIRQAVVLVDRSGGAAAAGMAEREIPYVALLTPDRLGLED
jgi:orotate phosphoribosyltransferase